MAAMGARRGLLLTDVEASTAHLRDLGDRFAGALARHFSLIRDAIAAEGGVEVGCEGDSVASVLPSAAHALRAAIAAQRALAAERWPEATWRVRMSVHAGDVEMVDGSAVGIAIHEAARIRDVSHGGQIVVSDAARADLDADQQALLVDLGLHQVRDIVGDIRLLQVVVPGLPDAFPALRTAHHANIPSSATSFIGRKEEIDAVSALLGEHRLVTLVGAGGCGKTRLAFEVAGRLGSGAVATAELAALTDPGQVPVSVAAAVGARSPDVLATTIGNRDLVLILDNCEHVLASVIPLVADLLARCPSLRMLCTSREPLAMSGEVTFTVPPLSAAQAAQLFLERAPRWLDDVQRATVESICDRLAGIPLAIELAAARLRSIDAEELAGRLDDQLTMLTGGARDIPRQQTMRATLDWSHALLGADEKAVFRRLAVFAGGCTIRAAEVVGSHPEPVDVLTALDQLVQRSLVIYDPAGARYRMLEPVRQYSLEHLRADGEEDAARIAHRDWAMRLAADGNRGLFVDQASWTATLDVEAANHAAAIAGALAAGEVDAASSIVASLAWYWFTAGRGEGTVWIPRVLERLDELDERGRPRTLLSAGIIYCDDPEDARPLEWLAAAEDGFRALGNRRGLGAALFWRGRALAIRFQPEAARVCFDEGAPLHEALGDPFGQGWCLTWLATLAIEIDDDLERAGVILDEVTALAERTGVSHVLAAALAGRSELHARAGELAPAVDLCEQSLALFREVGDRWQIALALHRRAALALHGRGDVAAAAADLLEALDLAESLRAAPDVETLLLTAAAVLLRADRDELAAELVGTTRARLAITEARGWYDATGGVGRLLDLVADPHRAEAVARGAKHDLRAAANLARKALQDLT
jgi:predicted ATPase/class 3 adenylate cyclase